MKKIDLNKTAIFGTLSFLGIVIAGTLLRSWHIGFAAPWIDEIHSLVYARNSVAHLIDVTRTTDIHPPLYFLTLKAWGTLFGESREAARMLSVVLGVISIGLVFAIARRLFDTPIAFMAMAFYASFPTAIHYAREIRMYPLLTVLFLLSFLCFLALHRSATVPGATRPAKHLGTLLGFALCLALAFYTHYTAAIFYMLYTLAALWFLIRGNRGVFLWTVGGLALGTILVVPQMIHLVSSSLSDPAKAWMEATTWQTFYGVSMSGYPYDKLLKPFVFVILLAGFYLIWRRDRDAAVLLLLFTAGGMILAGLIGIYEPIYLVRTIQVYTVFSALFAAVAVVALPRMLGVSLGVALIAVNFLTVIESEYLPAREPLPAETIAPLVPLLDAEEDRVFAIRWLRWQMLLLHVPLFDIATELNPDSLDAGIADARTAARCLDRGADDPCRSVVIVIEKESRFGVEAIAAWNAMADELKQRYPSHSEYLLSGYRTLVLSNDPAFLARIDEAL